MVVSSSQGASYGVAASATGAYTGFHADGSRFVQSGWGFTWDWSGAQRSFRKGIEYQLMNKRCYGTGYLTGDRHMWRPVGETGGVSHNDGLSRPGWDTCAGVDAGVWRRDNSDGHAYSYGAAVKMEDVIGINLSIDRNYYSSQRLEYNLKTRRRLCGNDAYPANAGKIIDRLL